MEWIIIGLLLVVIIALYIKNPNKLAKTITDATIKKIREKEPFIVQGSYNRLPNKIRQQVDSKLYAEIVSFALSVGIQTVEHEIKKK